MLQGYWTRCSLVVRDVPEFTQVQGVRGLHPVFLVATSGVDGGDAIWCQDPASTSPLWFDRQHRLGSAERALLLTLPAYSHFRCIHTSGVGLLFSQYPSRPVCSLRGYSYTPCVGSLFSWYPSHPAWSVHGSSHTPCVGSLFLRYPSHPAWLRLVSHALRGLVVLVISVTPSVVSSLLFSHALRGLVVLAVSVTPGVVSLRLFSHALRGLGVLGRDGRSAAHRDREVGLCREIIFNLFQVRSGLQPICAPPRHTTPMGLPSFPTAKQKKKKKKSKTENRRITNRHTKHIGESSIGERKRKRNPLLHRSPYRSGAVMISLSKFEDPEIRFG